MMALALALALAQTPQHRLFLQPNLPASIDYAFFEAFPASGAGTFGACSTTPPTGAKGEVLTFARTGNATCTKTATGGLATTGIANGDLVVLSANQPRVEYDSAGTLGLLVESARTNSFLRSEEFDNGAWTLDVGVTATANAATAPDGATTADRVQFAGGAAVLNRVLQLDSGIVAGAWVATVYIKGNGTSGTIYLWDDGSATSAVACSYVSTSWTRCTAATTTAGSAYFALGCRSSFLGMPATCPANDVFAWGAQGEQGAYATSYIPTTSAAVTRNAETATMPVAVSQLPISIAWSSAQTLPQGGASNDRIGVMTRELSGSGNFVVSYFQAQFRSDAVGSASGSALNGGTSVAGDRWATSHDTGGVLTSFKNGTQTATNTTAKTMNAATVVGIGASPAGLSHLDGIVSRVCVDPSPTRCR